MNAYEKHIKRLVSCHPDRGSSAIRTAPLPPYSGTRELDVIVPAYNVEKYIRGCIESILEQKTDRSFRVIAIDDGSTDRTGDVLESFRGIEVIHQNNRGLAAARNTGLDISAAKYVMFVDSDDELVSTAIEKLLEAVEDCDLAVGGYANFRGLKSFHITHRSLTGHSWGRVIRRSVFTNIQFPEGYWYEDSIMCQLIYPQTKIRQIEDILYLRRLQSNSITHSFEGDPRRLDSLWVTLRLMDDRKRLGLPPSQEYRRHLEAQTDLTLERIRWLGKDICESAQYVLEHKINEYFKRVTNGHNTHN